jgi:predicted enzyme related to lactoylglutathione lyase
LSLVPRFSGVAAALALVPALAFAQAPASPTQQAPLKAPAPAPVEGPLKHAPAPTTPAITAADLMTRLYIFADDSMMGREAGTPGGVKGTQYIADEAKRLGLEPAGDSGTFFQNVPLVRRSLAPGAAITIDGTPLVLKTDFLPVPQGEYTSHFGGGHSFAGTQVVYAGALNDPAAARLDPASVQGKLVLFDALRLGDGRRAYQFYAPQFGAVLERLSGAAGIAIATLDVTPPPILGYFGAEPLIMSKAENRLATDKPVGILVTLAAAQKLMGASLEGMKPGTLGRTLGGSVTFADVATDAPARNVVAILRGSDAKLRNTYVVVGAHNDHDGFSEHPADHDSLRVYNRFVREGGAETADRAPTADELAKMRVSLDSIRKLRPARLDSVMNGADDDGSGSMGVLEIAEQLAKAKQKPRRSILFVWHTAEEKGLFGSEWYSDNPTVPRDSIVAGVNIDMIGRGGAFDDVPDGGLSYLQLLGSRRLSSQLGDLVESLNKARKYDFKLDYQFDADGHPQQYYCRSDHYNYARYGIPTVFFSTGGHQDYHMPTDEPQYIDYDHFARVTNYIAELTTSLANQPVRLVVDKKKPDPKAACVQ